MSDSRKLDASQRQELAWLMDEADSAVQSWLQAEQVRWPDILTTLVSRLRLCGFDLEADGIASEVQATPKIGRRGCRNPRDLRQLRQRVVDRVRKRIVAIRKVVADNPSGGQKSITHYEAEAVARQLDKENVAFCYLKAEDMAKLIAQESGKLCSDTLVKGLPYWDEAMKRTGRGRKRGDAKGQGRKRGTAARPKSFSEEVEAVTGAGEKHQVLEELVEDEEMAKAEQALREQKQAIYLVRRSRLSHEEQRQTIAKLEAGEITPQEANQVVSICQQDSTRNRKNARSHD